MLARRSKGQNNPPHQAMDTDSTRALLCIGMGPVGDIVLQHYVEDVRKRADETMFYKDVRPLCPLWRCKHTDKRGRCRGRVTKAAVVQHCLKHQWKVFGDSNVEALMMFYRMCPDARRMGRRVE